MALLLHERGMEYGSEELVRMTLLEVGASPAVVDALIPTRPLQAGEQYRFHFDMTKCIGCRSCEVACNEQNGNPAEIQWRRVGELEGGVYPLTRRTYLSMGCNHCLSADCLRGCPVNAYTKDPLTGIVLHSAEACIGCQYCVWNCPYSVPQFNEERGVVGKCDMCRGRLMEGLEPACVNACPENAIEIEIVNKDDWRRNFATAESPGMPPAGQTISTTRITLPEHSSTWLERVDTGAVALEDSHPSLIVMTTAMQLAFGTFAVLWLRRTLDAASMTIMLMLTCAALAVSVFHLGRPAYAWRALKMWRRSWLSREVLCFALFFCAMNLCTAASWLRLPELMRVTAAATLLFGLFGTVTSAFIYRVKARPAWNMIHTPLDFLLSAGLMGAAMAGVMTGRLGMQHGLLTNVRVEAVLAAAWICNQLVKTLRLRASKNFESRATYNLLRGELLAWKVALGTLCAAAVPLFGYAPLPWLGLAAAVAAVMMGRYLFFVSVVPLGMALTFLKGRAAHGAPA